MLCNRIFVITCRGGKALLFDNKPDSKGKRHYKKFTSTDSRVAGIKAWCYMLNMIPDEFKGQVAVMLPSCISFLSFVDTRNFWVQNECTKSGEMLDEDTLNAVNELNELLQAKDGKVQNFGQSFVKAYKYKNEIGMAWKATNRIIPVEYVADEDIIEEEEAF